jgi:hypothetical protein
MDKPPPPCSFAGYVSEAGGQLVQDWYESLPAEEHDEIHDTVNHLASIPVTSWRRPEFDKVDAPLYEIRCKANKANHEIRIYGVFDPKIRGRFVFLYGNEAKKKDEDKVGKAVASKRWGLVQNGKASIHEFEFEKGID